MRRRDPFGANAIRRFEASANRRAMRVVSASLSGS